MNRFPALSLSVCLSVAPSYPVRARKAWRGGIFPARNGGKVGTQCPPGASDDLMIGGWGADGVCVFILRIGGILDARESATQ